MRFLMTVEIINLVNNWLTYRQFIFFVSLHHPTLLVMGSIEENGYRYSIDTFAKVSIVSILVSILRYPSKNPHHKLHIQKFVTYFDIFQLLGIELFQNFWVFSTFAPFLLHFGYFLQILFFWGHFCHYSSDNTKHRCLNKVSILNDTKRYRYTIDSIDTISHH